MEGRIVVKRAYYWIYVLAMRAVCRKIRIPQTQVEGKSGGSPKEILSSTIPRKASKVKHIQTVPQTDTGDWVEKT